MENSNNLENETSSANAEFSDVKSASASVIATSSEPTPTFRTVNDDAMDEEDDESSEDEDYDHSEHFYQLAKKQYEDILAQDPTNTEIKEKLATLIYTHNYANKRQKTK